MADQRSVARIAATTLAFAAFGAAAWAQPPTAPAAGAASPQAGRAGARPPAVVSPQVDADRRVTFRIYAPKADTVTLTASDIPAAAPPAGGQGAPAGPVFTRNENGAWEATVGPVPPGAFRYVFQVDGVRTLDPANTAVSESNTANWSLFHVPGIDAQDSRNVPHGAVASVYYFSAVLGTMRRMHVYTPPGYEDGRRKYPVFYLLHGSGDCDDSWTSVGRAGFILDNLIAAGSAVPMVVVMPAGHQPPPPAGAAATSSAGAVPATPPAVSPFTREFVTDVMPLVESRYRTITDRPHRAIAGLSMGGSQTLDIAFRHLDRFAYVGVFSSGATLGGGRGATSGATPAPPDWESLHHPNLEDPSLKKGTRLIWLATGVDDRLMPNTRTTVELLTKHGFKPVFKESPGAHTWLNWRDYLREFAPLLFR
jgi:enterochelin esterase-like enzyme